MKPHSRLLLRLLALVAFGCVSLLAQEQQVAKALARTKADLALAIEQLEKTRSEIAAQKPKLNAEFQKVEARLIEQRRLLRIARMGEQDRQRELRELQRDLAARTQDAAYLSGLLKDHALKIDTLAKPGSTPLALEPRSLLAGGGGEAATLEQRLAVLDASLARLEELMGGSATPGEAVAQDGAVLQGTQAAFGPVSYFLDDAGKAGGELMASPSGQLPRLVSESPAAMATLLQGKTTEVPVDPSGGNARALDELGGGPMALIRKGGLWIWPILLLALLSTIFGLIKLVQFLRYREPGDAWINAVLAALRTGERDKAEQLAAQQSHPAGAVLLKLVQTAEHSPDLVEETLYEQLMGVQAKASSMLPVIAITAATAPLLGLLGTVSGMISTFNLITLFGSGDPKPLAGGISEALITTLFGLVVAIPALIIHAFLSRRSQGIVQTTERLGLSFVNGLRTKS